MSSLLTVRETAERLRLSERTVRKRVAAGELPAVKLGPGPHAPVRIDESALAEFARPAAVTVRRRGRLHTYDNGPALVERQPERSEQR